MFNNKSGNNIIYRKIHCLTNEFHNKFHTKKTISHKPQSDECDIGFSSEIYCGIDQSSKEFFLNCMSLQREQAYPNQAKKAILESTVKSQRIGITLKLEIIIDHIDILVSFESHTCCMTDRLFGNFVT